MLRLLFIARVLLRARWMTAVFFLLAVYGNTRRILSEDHQPEQMHPVLEITLAGVLLAAIFFLATEIARRLTRRAEAERELPAMERRERALSAASSLRVESFIPIVTTLFMTFAVWHSYPLEVPDMSAVDAAKMNRVWIPVACVGLNLLALGFSCVILRAEQWARIDARNAEG